MTILSALLLITLAAAPALSSAPLPKTAPGIELDREHWLHPKQGGLISPMAAYAPNRDRPGYGDLVEMASLAVGGDTFDAVWVRRSTDNGKTWLPARELCILDRSVVKERDRKRLRILADSLFADETSGMMVLFVNYYVWPGPDGLKKRKVMLFYSADNGHTWDGPHQAIQQGEPFDGDHWMAYATYGKNMAAAGQVPMIRLRNTGPGQGRVVLPLYIQKLTDGGELYTPTWYFLECATMIGSWQNGRLVWDAISNKVGVTHKQSDRGVYEATVAEMHDGRCLMVMRMSNHGGKIKGCKMCSVSSDQCRTWSAPKPLTYDDGSWMYSSASNGILLRHSSGRVFYCGVITQTNTRSNHPRWPVCLAEVDQQSLMIRKASVRIVATRRADEPGSVQYVNHGIYEDRETGSLVVLTPRLLPKQMRKTSIEKYVVPIALFDH